MFDDQVRVGHVQLQQLPRSELVVEPVDRAVLQVRERIVSGRARQLVLAEYRLFLPGVELIDRVLGRLSADPVTALDGLAAVAPRRHAFRVDDLPLHVEPADQEVVAGVLEVLEYRSRVLPHQDRVRRIVVDAEVVAEPVLLADAVQSDPGPGRVGDVVVEVVARRPSRHRALLDPIRQPALLGGFEQRNEVLFEIDQILVHAVLLIAADESADRIDAQHRRGIEHAKHEVVLLRPNSLVVVQKVVEVSDVREPDSRRLERRLDPLRPRLVERLPEVQRVGHRIEHRFRRHVRLARMERRRKLNVGRAEVLRELQPVLDCLVRIGIADFARSELLQRRGEDANFHELRFERSGGHLV